MIDMAFFPQSIPRHSQASMTCQQRRKWLLTLSNSGSAAQVYVVQPMTGASSLITIGGSTFYIDCAPEKLEAESA
jgi:hypothetical protein